MKNAYLAFIAIILLALITIFVTLIHRYVIYPALNKPTVHENCTVIWNCNVDDGIFGRITCSCVYYEKNCVSNCEHSDECISFIYGCSLKSG
jgi:hypothetical protein